MPRFSSLVHLDTTLTESTVRAYVNEAIFVFGIGELEPDFAKKDKTLTSPRDGTHSLLNRLNTRSENHNNTNRSRKRDVFQREWDWLTPITKAVNFFLEYSALLVDDVICLSL